MDTDTIGIRGSLSQAEAEAIDPNHWRLGIGDTVQVGCPSGHVFPFVLQSLTINHTICPECGETGAFEFRREEDVYFTPDDDSGGRNGGPTVAIHFERLPAETWVRVHGHDEYWRIPADELIALVARARPNESRG